MKKTRLRKQSKTKESTLRRQLETLCKLIIRKKYPPTCYTCGKTGLSGSSLHTGHMIAKAALGAYLKYDLRVLRPQCSYCNTFLDGMGAVFIENMRRIEGDEYVDNILKDRNITVKAHERYTEQIQDYRRLIEVL